MSQDELFEIIHHGIPCDNLMDVVESINANGKCFTYFSQLSGGVATAAVGGGGVAAPRKPAAVDSDPHSMKIAVNRGYRFHSGRFMKLTVHFAREEYAVIPDT